MTESLSGKYHVPATLRPLLEAFARETLRSQPADLIEFGRTFFDALHLTQKSHPKTDVIGEEKLYVEFRSNLQQKLAARDYTSDFNNKQDLFGDSQVASQREVGQGPLPLQLQSQTTEPVPEATHRSSTRQSSNRSSTNNKGITSRSNMQQDQQSHPGSSHNSRPTSPTEIEAAKKIQAAYRGHWVRNHPEKFGIDTVDLSRRRSNDRLNSDNKRDLKRHSVGGYSLESTNSSPDDRAAIKIQKEIRGFLARKHVDALKKQNTEAATKIQAHIRGYLIRKKLGDDVNNSPSRTSLHSIKSDEVVN
ncbi:hypothetical protein M3Y96_00853200 [Aphelenchoides besseyi]|nr:hypothetical protein M3Y96_00853200 [Aphelenchoides besseyi]